MTEKYDYIIVGAGTAGGILAHNLTLAGAKCLLVEAGKYLTRETFPVTEADASAQMYWGGGMELSEDARMAFLRGKLVGGGSVVNQALMDRFDDVAINDWRDESGINFFNREIMDPLYEKAESMIALHTFKAEERTRNAELFVEGCEKSGYEWHFLRRAQKDCAFSKYNDCVACLGGCHRDSKQSTLVTYIRDAEKEGLSVMADTTIELINADKDEVKLFGVKDGKVVSFISLLGNEVGGLFVHAAHQRNGIGHQLMDFATKIRMPLTLDVFKDNPIGRSFYKQYGFVETGEVLEEETGKNQIRMALQN